MNKSESIAEIATALAKAQAEISNASKNAKNPHFKSVYADLAEILNTVRPVFSLHDIAVIQAPQYENGAVTVETMLTHKSGEWISSSVSAPVSKQDAQGVGSAITYCRRYGLAAMAGIAQEDDDANGAVGGPNNRKQVAPQPQRDYSKQVQAINGCADEASLKALCETFDTETRRALNADVKAKYKQVTAEAVK